jgi:hypothetical protein
MRRDSNRRTVFTLARWAVGSATLLAVAAMSRYPGGTLLDHSTRHYSFFNNFLSDLGMTVAYSGQRNRLGAILFTLSLSIVVTGLGACLIGLVGLYSEAPRSRRFARVAVGVGLLVCGAFIGVALTPEDRMMGVHVKLTLLAFRAFPVASLLLVFASLSSNAFPRRMAIAWAFLTMMLIAYVAVLSWGPALSTPGGLRFQVAAQKIVSIGAVGIFVYLSIEADRFMAASRTARRRIVP